MGVKCGLILAKISSCSVFAGRAPPTGLEPVTLRDAIVNCQRYSLLLDHARDLREQTRTGARHFASLAAISWDFSGTNRYDRPMQGRPPMPLGTHGKIRIYRRGDAWMARALVRDWDGVTRYVQKQGRTQAAAQRPRRVSAG